MPHSHACLFPATITGYLSLREPVSALHMRRLHSLPSIMEECGRQEKGDLVEIWLRYSYDGMLSLDMCCNLSDKLVGLHMMLERAQDNLRRYKGRGSAPTRAELPQSAGLD